MDQIENNPVGKARFDLIKDLVENLLDEWKKLIPVANKVKNFWTNAIYFLFKSIDTLINFIEGMIPGGADKKATVLLAFAFLYDHIISANLPFWLKPFDKKIRVFVIDIVVSLLIDLMVSKYNKGSWQGTGLYYETLAQKKR